MTRKQWMITGILTTILIVVVIMILQNDNSDEPIGTGPTAPVSVLTYCSEEQVKPCVVSFGIDVDGNMLVNILLPDLSYPNFLLKIKRGEMEIGYKCQRVSTALNNAYCIGEKLPPGESLHLMLFSVKDDTLLAEGELSIIGLAFPTLEVVTPVIETTSTEEAATLLPDTPTTTPTLLQLPIPTKPNLTTTPTGPSYPNPTSYPNSTSYP